MDIALVLANFWAYVAQLTVLLGAGLVLPRMLGLRPRPSLLIHQVLLLACVLLPLAQPWRSPVLSPVRAGVAGATQPASAEPPAPIVDWDQIVLLALGGGLIARMVWLAAGLQRLRRYRREAMPFGALPDTVAVAQSNTGVSARWLVSDEITGPVTFGFLDPVVLLPAGFGALPAETQTAIATHELLHIRRGDWLASLIEEFLCAALWFHPLVWWLRDRLRLTREQVVDRETVTLTASTDTYVAALLESAGAATPDLAPASSFFFRRGLARRIRSLYEEVPDMSRFRLTASYTFGAACLGCAVWIGAARFPLMAAPQPAERGIASVDGQTKAELLYQHPVTYPMAARRDRVEGFVEVEAVLNPDGTVADARVIDGPEPLRRAALESVLQWMFLNEAKSRRTLRTRVEFRLAPDGGAGTPPLARIGQIDVDPSAGRAKEMLEARLEPYKDQLASPGTMHEIAMIVKPFGLVVSMARRDGQDAVSLKIAPTDMAGVPVAGETPRIRVGGNVQAGRIVNKVPPVYPPLARAARIQGSVQFTVIIGVDGGVQNIQLLSGHPLLVEPAQQALSQWTYQPTWLNGKPVEVVTRVDINFTLAD